MADDRTYIRVHDGMDEHPKIEPLSDGAFRLLMKCWFYCSRNHTDGRIADAAWKRRGTPRTRKELLAANLAEQCDGFVQMHDYLEHQRSAAEIEEIKAGRGAGGALGNHIRWHLKRRVRDPKCNLCYPAPPDESGSQDRSDDRSLDRSQNDRPPIANGSHSQRQRQISSDYENREGYVPNASDSPPPFPDHCPEHAHDAVPPACGRCKETREANAARPHLALVSPANPARVPHCGQCDETRHIETPRGVIRCPNCHPDAQATEAS